MLAALQASSAELGAAFERAAADSSGGGAALLESARMQVEMAMSEQAQQPEPFAPSELEGYRGREWDWVAREYV